MVIDGNGHSIHASNAARIFYCTGKNVTLKNYLIKKYFHTTLPKSEKKDTEQNKEYLIKSTTEIAG